MTEFLAKVRVVASAAVTWLVIAEGVLLAVVAEVVPQLPEPWGSRVGTFVASALAVLATAIVIIRRVTPVEPEERGILPQSPPAG